MKCDHNSRKAADKRLLTSYMSTELYYLNTIENTEQNTPLNSFRRKNISLSREKTLFSRKELTQIGTFHVNNAN